MKKLLISLSIILAVLVFTSVQSLASDLIYGCYNKSGQLRIVSDPGSCDKKNETAISWNKEGLQGEKGDPGDPGLPGDPGECDTTITDRLQAQIDRLQTKLEECCGIEWTDLGALVNVDIHGTDARWSMEECGYLFEAGKPGAYISLPYELVGSYELLARLNIIRSMETVAFILPVDDAYIEFGIASGNAPSETAVMYLKGLTPTQLSWPDQEIIVGKEYKYLFDIVVNQPSCVIQIFVNNGLLYSWKGNISDIAETIQPKYAPPSWIELKTAYYTVSCFIELKARRK